MGKSSKKSATKVETVPALAPTKTLKKGGKKEAEQIVEKTKSARKQKKDSHKEVPAKIVKKNVDINSSSDSEPEQKVAKSKVAAVKKGPAAAAAKKDDSNDYSNSEDDSSSDDEDIAAKKKPVSTIKNGLEAAAKKDETSDESDSENSASDDDVPAAKKNSVAAVKNATVPVAKKEQESSDDSEDENSEESSDEEEPKQKKMKVQEPTTPVTPKVQTSEGSKTVFVGNLPYKVEKADMENFFKEAGEVIDVRFAMRPDGCMKGFGHVEFASADAAKKAVEEMNGKELLGRALRLDLAAEKGEYTPQSGVERNSFQKSEGGQVLSIFIRGLDTNGDLFNIKDCLKEHFGSCGEITRLYVPTDQDGYVKGVAYMDFSDNDAFNKALELDQSEFGESVLSVQEARPKTDNNAGGGRGGRSGGRDSGGRFGGRGRGDRGGRGGRGGRGRFGGGGRGRY